MRSGKTNQNSGLRTLMPFTFARSVVGITSTVSSEVPTSQSQTSSKAALPSLPDTARSSVMANQVLPSWHPTTGSGVCPVLGIKFTSSMDVPRPLPLPPPTRESPVYTSSFFAHSDTKTTDESLQSQGTVAACSPRQVRLGGSSVALATSQTGSQSPRLQNSFAGSQSPRLQNSFAGSPSRAERRTISYASLDFIQSVEDRLDEHSQEDGVSPHEGDGRSCTSDSITTEFSALKVLCRHLQIARPEPSQLSKDDRAQTLASLQSQEKIAEVYAGMLDALESTCFLITLDEGIIVYCNDSAQSLLKKFTREIVGCKFDDLIYCETEHATNFTYKLKNQLTHSRSVAQGAKKHPKTTGIIALKLPDSIGAKHVTVSYTGKYLMPGNDNLALLFVQDFGPQLDTVTRLRLKKAVFHNNPIGVVVAKMDGEIVDVNAIVCFWFKLNKDALLDRDRPGAERTVAVFLGNPHRSKENRARHDMHAAKLEAFEEKYKANPNYTSDVVVKENEINNAGHNPLETEDADGNPLHITLAVIVVNGYLIAYLRNREELVTGVEHRALVAKTRIQPEISQKYFAGQIPKGPITIQIEKAVLCMDLAKSSRKLQSFPAVWRLKIIDWYLTMMNNIVTNYGGIRIKNTGDGFIVIVDPQSQEKLYVLFTAFIGIMIMHHSVLINKAIVDFKKTGNASGQFELASPILQELSDSLPEAEASNFFIPRCGATVGEFAIGTIGDSPYVVGQSNRNMTDSDVYGVPVDLAARLEGAGRVEPGQPDVPVFTMCEKTYNMLYRVHRGVASAFDKPVEKELKGFDDTKVRQAIYGPDIEKLAPIIEAEGAHYRARAVEDAQRRRLL